jgi:hypothetical protein
LGTTIPELKKGDFYCINFTAPNEVIELQGVSGQSEEYNYKTFSLVVGSCEKLSNITGRTDCKNESESYAQ